MAVTLKNLVEFLKRYPIGVICGLVGAIMIGAIYVRSNRVDELGAQSKQAEEQGRKLLGEIRNATSLVDQYAALSAKTKDLESRLVRGSERALNQQYFYRIESDTGVKEISLQPTSSGAEPRRGDGRLYSGIGFTVTVEGDYRQILDFVGRIESGQYFYRLISASAIRRGELGQAGSASRIALSLNLELLGLP